MRGKINVPADRPGRLSSWIIPVIVALLMQGRGAGAACLPVTITSPPASLTIPAGCRATFSVEVSGTGPFHLQWRGNGQSVPGATNLVFTTSPLSLDDSESFFSVQVSNDCGQVVSGNAVVFVSSDPIPPALSGAVPGGNLQQVVVSFRVFACNGPGGGLQTASAQNILNYSINGGLVISNAQLLPSGTNVLLTTSPQLPGATYTLTAHDILDLGGNVIAPNSQAPFGSLPPTRGFLRREVYANVPGLTVADLTNSAKFPGQPDSSGYVTAFAAPVNVADNYGQRLSGYLLPPVTGDYVFYLAADDQAALYLSPDENPALKSLLIFGADRVGPLQWIEPCPGGVPCISNSIPIPLEAGRRYYVEAIMKEAFSTDHLAVTWQLPGQAVPTNGAPAIEGEYLAAYADPNSITLVIAQQPQSIAAEEGHVANFFVTAITIPANVPVFYQWLRNGVIIPGAHNPSFRTDLLSPADDGATYSVVLTVPGGSQTSQGAMVRVVSDTTPPIVTSAHRDRCTPQFVELIFDWLVTPASATNAANYSIDHGVSVLGAVLGEDGRRVSLTINSMDGITAYQLTLNHLQDFFGNELAANTTVPITLTGSAFTGTGAQNLIVVEGEHFDVNHGLRGSNAWSLEDGLPGHAGSGYMVAGPDLGLALNDQPASYTNGPQLDYCLNFPVAGVYYLWLRGSTPDGLGNSVHAGLDGVSDINFYRRIGNNVVNWGNNATAFGWVNDSAALAARIVVPSAGLHTFNLWMREDGVRLDRFLLTTDAEYAFADKLALGPPESPRGLGDRPTLQILLNGSIVVLQWDGNAILEASDDLSSSWQTAEGAVSPYETSPIGLRRFYRLRLP